MGAALTLELRPTQQLQWQHIYTIFLRLSKMYTGNGTQRVSYRSIKIYIYEQTKYLTKYNVCRK